MSGTAGKAYYYLEDMAIKGLVLGTKEVDDGPEQHLAVAVHLDGRAVLGQRHCQGVDVADVDSDCSTQPQHGQQVVNTVRILPRGGHRAAHMTASKKLAAAQGQSAARLLGSITPPALSVAQTRCCSACATVTRGQKNTR